MVKFLNTALKLLAYDTYCSVCEILEAKPLGFEEYVKRVINDSPLAESVNNSQKTTVYPKGMPKKLDEPQPESSDTSDSIKRELDKDYE